MQAIDLKFDGDEIEVVLPQDKIPICFGMHPCQFFEERRQFLDDDEKIYFDQWFCKKANRPVMEIWHSGANCPRNLWMVGRGDGTITMTLHKRPTLAPVTDHETNKQESALDRHRDNRGGPKIERRRPNRRAN